MRNVHKLHQLHQLHPEDNSRAEAAVPLSSTGGNDGGPPMDLLERVIRIEAAVPNLATKGDVADFRSEMYKEIANLHKEIADLRSEMYQGFAMINQNIEKQTWRLLMFFFGTMTPICGGMIAATYYIATHTVK